jgi:hypothetical protein
MHLFVRCRPLKQDSWRAEVLGRGDACSVVGRSLGEVVARVKEALASAGVDTSTAKLRVQVSPFGE